MKFWKALEGMFTLLAILTVIYIGINIIHFSWLVSEPEGFWSFFYFIEILGIVLIGIILIAVIIFFTIGGIVYLIKDFPKNISIKNILKASSILFLLIIITIINTIAGSGLSLFVNKKLADRYSYINKSEELMSEGREKDALKYAKKAYDKYKNKTKPSNIFILSRLFYFTDYGTKLTISKQYETTINYAFCLYQNNDFNLVEGLYQDALLLSEHRVLKKDENYKIFPYLCLSDLYRKKGNFQKAEVYFNTLLQFSKKASKEDIVYLCFYQDSFSDYFLRAGDFKKARDLRRNNILLLEEKYKNPKSIFYLTFLLSAISVELISGNHEKAGIYLEKASAIAEKHNEHEGYKSFLLMKGLYCNYVSRNGNGNKRLITKSWYARVFSSFSKDEDINLQFKEEAENSFAELVDLEKDKNGENSLGYLQSYIRLGFYFFENGEQAKANKIFRDVLDICEKNNFTDSELYYSTLSGFAYTEYLSRGFNSVKTRLKSIEDYYFGTLISKYSFLTEKEKETFNPLIDNKISPNNSIYIATNTEESCINLFNNIIAIKEIALYANENTRKHILLLDSNQQIEYKSILKTRDSFSTILNIMEHSEKIKELDDKERQIQNSLNKLSQYKPFNPREINYEKIKTALSENEVAIEFIHTKEKSNEQYYALVVKKNLPAPKLIPLFKESDIKRLIKSPGDVEERINRIYTDLKDSIYSFIWGPIEKEISPKSKVYISLSGILHTISFPALLDNKDIDFVLLGSTRKIISIKSKRINIYKNAVIVGDVNYGNISQNNRSDIFSELPYTKEEINNVLNIVQRDKNIIPKVFTRDSATEFAFKRVEILNPSIIHLATHGYYNGLSYNMTPNLGSTLYSEAYIDPMLNSGIILAGANNITNSYSGNDGRLSAQEIARMNFQNLDLVVLSACETGLGDINGYEGVFGLQRAFKLAGANSIIVSLWKVPDSATAELMRLFYENYFGKKFSKSKSLRESQLTLKQKYSDPFKWGGFVLLEN